MQLASWQPSDRLSAARANSIWIASKAVEEWPGGEAPGSTCCSVCGDAEFRTMELGGESFEEVPAELVIQAALLVVSHGIRQENPGCTSERRPGCCVDEK